jgi:uncharacterized protein
MMTTPMPEQLRHIVWTPEDEPGIEYVKIFTPAEGVSCTSHVIRLWEGAPVDVTYFFKCDIDWRIRSFNAYTMGEQAGTYQVSQVTLIADGLGNWEGHVGFAKPATQGSLNHPMPDLQGCIDVDFMLTPLTNTLPIKRLALAPGESREISVVYISAPTLDVRPFRQRYTRLDDANGAQQYRYGSLESGFTAVLPVDGDGYVLDYPAIWRRIWPR